MNLGRLIVRKLMLGREGSAKMQFLTPLYTREPYTNLWQNDDQKFVLSCFVFATFRNSSTYKKTKASITGNNTPITYTLMMKLHSTFNMQDINKF